MPIADRNGFIDDNWIETPDESLPAAGAWIIVSFERLKSEHNSLFAEADKVGVEVQGDVELEDLKPFLSQLDLIVVRFDTMKDGRPFSLGRLLRERYGYEKDLRAAGPFISDQVLFLLRCGFTSFDLDDNVSIETFKRTIDAYSVWYQRASDKTHSVIDLRHRNAGCEKREGGNA